MRTSLFLAGMALCSSVWAGPTVQLQASANALVSNDEMVVTLSVEHDSNDVGVANRKVLEQTRAALEQARKVAGVKAKLAGMSTQPNWTTRGRPDGWKVRASVVLESMRMPELAELAGDLSEHMQVASVQFRLSTESRRKLEQELLATAAKRFSEKAADVASAFGYKNATARELSISGSTPGYAPPRPMMAMARMSAESADMAMPTEGGESEVSVTVTGSVELQ
jgi:predicted secreted protein